MDKIQKLEKDIKSLSIQGATNIAYATLEGINIAISEGIRDSFELKKIGQRLSLARPAEPLAQNAVSFIFSDHDRDSSYYLKQINSYKSLINTARIQTIDYAVKEIKDGGKYLTHCHSSTVTAMFIKAKNQGKIFAVFATETRPKLQGRITVRELLDAGMDDITMVVDDVVDSLLERNQKQIDAIFIGADLLMEDGFINKVGSLGIIRSAERNNIPLYCVSTLLKFHKGGFSSDLLDERDGSEIWPEAPDRLKFYAPAFDYIPYDNLKIKIICESGEIIAKNPSNTAYSLYPFLKS